MIDTLPHLKQLIRQLQQVPYLASKNLYKVTEYFLQLDTERTDQFIAALIKAKQQLVQCGLCWAWQEKNSACGICSDSRRDITKICVVETWQDFLALDKTGGYQGLYHILGGAISPLDGLSPEDLTIDSLLERIENQKYTEVILALNQTPEGEATAAFIARKLQRVRGGSALVVSCLARGVPVGSVLESMDRITVYKAIAERRPF